MARVQHDNLFAEINPDRTMYSSRLHHADGVFLRPYRIPSFFSRKKGLHIASENRHRKDTNWCNAAHAKLRAHNNTRPLTKLGFLLLGSVLRSMEIILHGYDKQTFAVES